MPSAEAEFGKEPQLVTFQVLQLSLQVNLSCNVAASSRKDGKTGSLEVRLDPRRLVLMSATVDATQFCHLVTLTSQSARMLWKFQ